LCTMIPGIHVHVCLIIWQKQQKIALLVYIESLSVNTDDNGTHTELLMC